MALFAALGAGKSVANVVTSVLPQRMFSSGGRGPAQLPGFNATMKLDPNHHFFTDERGREWGWAAEVGHLDPLSGDRGPFVYSSSVLGKSVDYESHARMGHAAPAYVVRDLESLVRTGRLPQAQQVSSADYRSAYQQALNFIYYSGRCR